MTPTATIAILDDDAGVRDALTSLVRSLGYAVRGHASADDFLRDERRDPDCLILDVQMPGLTGDALHSRLLAEGRRIPTIFMTAFPQGPARERMLAAGAVAFLEKPVDGDEIARLLVQILDRGSPQTLV